MGLTSIWQWLQDREHRAVLGFLGAGIAALVAACWTVYVHYDDSLEPPPSLPPQSSNVTNVAGDFNINVEPGAQSYTQTGDGTIVVTNIQGIPPEIHRKLAEQLGITDAALTNFFRMLQRDKVPPETLDSTLREIASQYKELESKLAALSTDNPAITLLKQEARQALDAGELEHAKSRVLEALVEAADSMAEVGEFKVSEMAYEEAAWHYQKAASLLPEGNEDKRAEYLTWEGFCWVQAGSYVKAEEPLKQALGMREQKSNQALVSEAEILNHLGLYYYETARYDEAEAIFYRSLAIRKQALGTEHYDVAQSLNNLGILYSKLGRHEEEERLYKQALTIYEKALGSTHLKVGHILDNLGAVYLSLERYDEAASVLERALAIVEEQLGSDHPDVAYVLLNLGGLKRSQGKYEEADVQIRRALAIIEEKLGSKHPETASALSSLGRLRILQQRYTEAERLLKNALSIRKQVLGEKHPDLAQSLYELGILYLAEFQEDKSKQYYNRAVKIMEEVFGPEHSETTSMRKRYQQLFAVVHEEPQSASD